MLLILIVGENKLRELKEVKIKGSKFIVIENGFSLKCCFDKNHFISSCDPDCVACEINNDGREVTATCLRGPFIFARIKKPE
jgi:hypothetical protein